MSLTVVMLCVCTKRCTCVITNSSEKQFDWLSHARPAPFPFPLILFPGEITYEIQHKNKHSLAVYILQLYGSKDALHPCMDLFLQLDIMLPIIYNNNILPLILINLSTFRILLDGIMWILDLF